MGRAERRTKDQAMANRMKDLGIQRTTGQCPVCHKTVGNGGKSLISHFVTSCGK